MIKAGTGLLNVASSLGVVLLLGRLLLLPVQVPTQAGVVVEVGAVTSHPDHPVNRTG